MSLRRLTKELKDFEINPPPNCTAGPVDNDFYHWHATLMGPEGTPYENGIYFLNIMFPRDYPFKPPKIMFTTKIYHCSINDKGGFFLDMLRGDWSPKWTISMTLRAISSLLAHPNADDPLVPYIAKLYRQNRVLHDKRANEHAHKYADAPLKQYNAADVPVVQKYACRYDTKTQTVDCRVTVKHQTYDKYKEHIKCMYLQCEDQKQALDINVTEYQLTIHKVIEYGTTMRMETAVCFTRSKALHSLVDLRETVTYEIYVDVLREPQYLALIEGYLKQEYDGTFGAIPVDVVRLCYAYYWTYEIEMTFKDIAQCMHEQREVVPPSDVKQYLHPQMRWKDAYLKCKIAEAFGYGKYPNITACIYVQRESEFPIIKITARVEMGRRCKVRLKHKEQKYLMTVNQADDKYTVAAFKQQIKTHFGIDAIYAIDLRTEDNKEIASDLDFVEEIVCFPIRYTPARTADRKYPVCVVTIP